MTRTVHVTPGGLTPLQAKIGIIVTALFLIFGLVFAVVVSKETPSSEGGLKILQAVFLLIWVTACLSIIVFYARLLSKEKTAAQNSLIDLHVEESTNTTIPESDDFESRLRKLERLKRDGLINGDEYQAKRDQILQEKW